MSVALYSQVNRTIEVEMELPCEILTNEILLRLPIKHLLRCRCVSKGWCSLIDSNAFVKKHLKRMIECDARGVIFIGLRGELYLADFESLGDDSASVVQLDNPLRTCISNQNIVGNSANGLVYMVNDEMKEFVVFNPSTRKARKIPSAPSRFLNSYYYLICCGFGYDCVNDDYKILKIALDNYHFIIGIVLYSIKTNEWTWIDDVPRNITKIFTTDGICARGSLYFLARNQNSDILLGFNFGLQQFEEFPCPPINRTTVGCTSTWLDSFEGSLSYVECFSESDSHPCMDVWVFNHSREDNHWFKSFSLDLPRGFQCSGPVALSRSKKNVLFVMNKGNLVWYDIERKTFQVVKICGIPTGVKAYLYTESLLQFTEDNLLQKASEDKDDKHKKRDDVLSKEFELSLEDASTKKDKKEVEF